MITKEAWYKVASDAEVQRASQDFRRDPGMRTLDVLLKVLTRLGQDQLLWDAVAKVPVYYETQDFRYRRRDPEDDWEYAGDSAPRAYEDDMAWLVSHLTHSWEARNGTGNSYMAEPLPSIGDTNKTERQLKIMDSEQAEMVSVLLRLLKS